MLKPKWKSIAQKKVNELFEDKPIPIGKDNKKGWDDGIQKLRRTSRNFVDEIDAIEQNYVNILNNQEW